MGILVSIIICTRNRAEHLRQTLEAMRQVCVPAEISAELLVVDNASTDSTAEVVKACQLPQMSVQYIYEGRKGQCYARNAGISGSGGGVILFTDDDVLPPRNWIEGMCAPILAGEADAVIGGITIAPHLERPWMQSLHKAWLASTDHDKERPRAEMIGANMAFAKEVLVKVPAFDTDLGPGALGFFDESLFSRQLARAGYKFQFASDTVVEHHFSESRLLRSSFIQTAQKMGQSCCYVDYHWSHRDIRKPQRRLLHATLRLFYWRLKRLFTPRKKEGAPSWELELITNIWYYKQWLVEQKHPRNYEKNGFIRRDFQGTQPTALFVSTSNHS